MKKQIFEVSNYPVIVIYDDENKYYVECPLFDGCYSQGETLEEALENIKDVIKWCIKELQWQVALKKKILYTYVDINDGEIAKIHS